METPFFSIVIPTYNRASLLKRCIESILAQTYDNWEAIVVDNYSADNTEDVVRSFNDERIKFVKNHNNGIIAVSRNKALDMAQGNWVCFLDSDDCWLPKKLERLLPFLENYDLIYHGLRKNIPRTKIFQRIDRYFYELQEPHIPNMLMRGDCINPSCSCVSAKVIGQTRFSEERELIACEDFDFFLQLLAKKIRVKYLREILTLYDVSGCSHDESASERDLQIYKRWDMYLNDEEKKELEFQSIQRNADYLRINSRFKEANVLYKKLFASELRSKRITALKGVILCHLRLSFSERS